MHWSELATHIPWRTPEDAPLHSVVVTIHESEAGTVAVSLPGKYWDRTQPQGGDFVVQVSTQVDTPRSPRWITHADLLWDFQAKRDSDPRAAATAILPLLAAVVQEGADPEVLASRAMHLDPPGLPLVISLVASQCIAMCEYRRFGSAEWAGGGRFLPARFATGILVGRWLAEAAVDHEKAGLTGLRDLRRVSGGVEPSLAQVLDAALAERREASPAMKAHQPTTAGPVGPRSRHL